MFINWWIGMIHLSNCSVADNTWMAWRWHRYTDTCCWVFLILFVLWLEVSCSRQYLLITKALFFNLKYEVCNAVAWDWRLLGQWRYQLWFSGLWWHVVLHVGKCSSRQPGMTTQKNIIVVAYILICEGFWAFMLC